MPLWLKCFFTLIILAIAKNSSAEIPPCKYDETINISHVKPFNDVYIYEHFEIPTNLTGEFDYKDLMDGSRVPVKSNLRACICKVRPCIRICCARKNMLSNGECNDGVKKEIQITMLDRTIEDELSLAELKMVPQYNSTKLMVLRKAFQPWDDVFFFSLKRDEYTMLKDGSIFLHESDEYVSNDKYCLYPEIYSDFPETIWFVYHQVVGIDLPGVRELNIISLVCQILILAVYLSVEKLRNLFGKCLICYIFCMCMVYFFCTLSNRLLISICAAAGYINYYFSVSMHLWLSVVSFHLWKFVTSLNRDEPRYRFLIYNTFVWCTAAIPTGVIFLMDQMSENDPDKLGNLPNVGYIECSVNGVSHFYTLIIIPTTFSVTMSVLTAIYIWKVKREVKRFAQQDQGSTTCIEFDFQTYINCLRLFLIMGAFWLLDQLVRFLDHHFIMFSNTNRYIYAYIKCSYGIILLFLLILKSNTLKIIMER
ncbi:probable G-protein coupled receptor Mth-like 12 [Drosophila teissieri]|uniref:probable G-protein coupled receptor Mth-like 12 n=1 Tax=Drosophila teissieri TaxID=7243 RepID=UPI001CB9F7F8|nr:probable G-protein coupled receptor Mth-like 12 [Drosophila teissieri]